jgi:hypothetical protein
MRPQYKYIGSCLISSFPNFRLTVTTLLRCNSCPGKMSRNEPYYSRFEQHPDDIVLAQYSKHPQHTITQAQASSTGRIRSPLTLLREWKWEIATWLLGSCALGAIIALLIIFQDRPLRDWTPHVRPAPVVAALSQIAQSALLFSVSSCIGQLKWYVMHTLADRHIPAKCRHSGIGSVLCAQPQT